MGTCRPWIEFKSYLWKSTIVYKPSPAKLHQRDNFIFWTYFGRFATVGSLWNSRLLHSHEHPCESCSKLSQLWRKILMRHCIKIQLPTGGWNVLKWSQFCNVCIMRKRSHILAEEQEVVINLKQECYIELQVRNVSENGRAPYPAAPGSLCVPQGKMMFVSHISLKDPLLDGKQLSQRNQSLMRNYLKP